MSLRMGSSRPGAICGVGKARGKQRRSPWELGEAFPLQSKPSSSRPWHHGEHGRGSPRSTSHLALSSPAGTTQDEPWDDGGSFSSRYQEGGCICPLHPKKAASDPDQPPQMSPQPLTGLMPQPQHGLGSREEPSTPKQLGHPRPLARGWYGEESLREGEEGVKSPALPAPPTASLLTLGGRE